MSSKQPASRNTTPSRCFHFKQFAQDCPLTHTSVVDHLCSEQFPHLTGKRQQKARQNLGAILDATFSLSNEIGFAKMSMRDLHRACGLSLGALYNYFDSKEALAMSITETLNHIAFDWLPRLIQDETLPARRLERLVRGHIYLSELLRPWFYFVFMEIKTLPDAHKQKACDVELRFQSLLDSLYGTPLLPASHVMALMQDWHVKHWKYRQLDIDTFADSVNTIAQSMLKS